jgi:uncharacterized membrane protein (UPF0127 family)
MHRTFQVVAALSLALALALSATAAEREVALNAGVYVIRAEVVDTPETRARGLMYRESLAVNHGMLFVFPESDQHCFWMKNTLIPLSIAFLDERGVIVNLADMQPKSEDHHCSAGPVRYALEMNQGWFAARHIKPGFRISGVDGAARAQ